MASSRAKLRVLTTLPEKWYKDEGGRDKCMEIDVELVDALNKPVATRKVPLAVSLEYEDGLKVRLVEKVVRVARVRCTGRGYG